MGAVVFCTVGTRDVKLDGKYFNQYFREELINDSLYNQDVFISNKISGKSHLTPRKAGEYILSHLDEYKNRLDFPIIEPIIEYIGYYDDIKYLYLVVTNQKLDGKNCTEYQYLNDSYYFGEIIQKLIPIKYKKIKKVQIRTIEIKKDVEHYEYMKDFWEEKFWSKNINKEPFESVRNGKSKIYICPIGGIDAIKSTLLISAILKFKKQCIHIMKDENIEKPSRTSFSELLSSDVNKDIIKRAINRNDYVTAIEVFNETYETGSKEYIVKIIEAMKERCAYNFQEASKIIWNLRSNINIESWVKKEIDNLEIEFNELEYDTFKKIQELYINARIKWEQEQYVDFLLRIFGLLESLTKYLLSKYLGVEIDDDNYDKKPFIAFVEARKGLKEYFENPDKYLRKNKIEYLNGTNTYNILKVFQYIVLETGKDKNEFDLDENNYREIYKFYQMLIKIRSLSQLRNKCFVTHRLSGLSKSMIYDKLQEGVDKEFLISSNYKYDTPETSPITIEEVFSEIEECLNIRFDNPEENSFLRINQLILYNL